MKHRSGLWPALDAVTRQKIVQSLSLIVALFSAAQLRRLCWRYTYSGMKKYTADDIKRIDWEAHVREHPEMYFPTSEVNEKDVSRAIEYSARILGAIETDFKEIDGWSYFCADVDWILKSEFQFESIHKIFCGPGPFPEANRQNAFRSESLCPAFSSSVYTASNGEVVVLKGSAPTGALLDAHLRELSDWKRVVGFKFIKSA